MGRFTVIFMVYFLTMVVIKAGQFRIKGEGGGVVMDDWTFSAIFASYLIVVTGALYEYFWTAPRVAPVVSIVGYCLATAGVVIMRRCIRSLGPYWSPRIEVKKGHQIREEGPYRASRHPYYLASLLELGGLCLILNSFRMFAYLVVVHIPIVMARIRSEERVLTTVLGSRYVQYKERIPIIPVLPSLTAALLRKFDRL